MNTKANHAFATTSYDVKSINILEMKSILDMRSKVCDVLRSHTERAKNRGDKKKYLQDEDLIKIYSILSKISENEEVDCGNEFENAEKSIRELLNADNNCIDDNEELSAPPAEIIDFEDETFPFA